MAACLLGLEEYLRDAVGKGKELGRLRLDQRGSLPTQYGLCLWGRDHPDQSERWGWMQQCPPEGKREGDWQGGGTEGGSPFGVPSPSGEVAGGSEGPGPRTTAGRDSRTLTRAASEERLGAALASKSSMLSSSVPMRAFSSLNLRANSLRSKVAESSADPIRSVAASRRSSRAVRRGANSSRTAATIVAGIPFILSFIASILRFILSFIASIFLRIIATRGVSRARSWSMAAAFTSNTSWMRVVVGVAARCASAKLPMTVEWRLGPGTWLGSVRTAGEDAADDGEEPPPSGEPHVEGVPSSWVEQSHGEVPPGRSPGAGKPAEEPSSRGLARRLRRGGQRRVFP